MKTLFLTLIVILTVHSLYSQNSEPTPWNFTLDGNVGPFNPNNYQQTNILTGFQWSSTLGMNNQ
jgi:hypothetical protein